MAITDLLAAVERLESKTWSEAARIAALAARRAKMHGHAGARADEEAARVGQGHGHGYGRTRARAIRRGDHPDHPLPAGKYGAGDPRNNPEYEKYVHALNGRIEAAKAAGHETHVRFGQRRNGKLTGLYKPERAAEHERIIDNIMKAHEHVPSDRQAVMLGGLPGSGKSTFLKNHGHGLGKFLEVDKHGNPTNAIVINPDEMKSLLMNGRDAKGRRLVPRTKGLTEGEHASLVHEESSHLAAMLARRAMKEGKNTVFDITLGDAKKANAKYLHNEQGTGAKDLGYKVHHAFVEGDMATSLHRAGLRHKHAEAETGARTHVGRYVDYSHILSEANSTGALDSEGKVAASKNRVESDKLIKQGVFDSAVRYDNKTHKMTVVKAASTGKKTLSEFAQTVRSATVTERK